MASAQPETTQPSESARSPSPAKARRWRGLSPWWHLVIALVVLALVQSFLVKL